MTRLHLLALVALVACTAGDDVSDDTAATDTSDTQEQPTGHQYAIVTTVSADYTTGSIATISLDDWSISDELFVTSGDAAVSADEGMVFQINRLGYDTARMYTPGEWTTPNWEKELADASNPGAADVCGGSLFIALYGTDTLGVYDPHTGNQTGTVDLSQFDDGDGVGPEPGSLVEVDGKLYVGMNRLDRANGWVDAGGAVAEVDCATRTVTNSWSIGSNTSVAAWPGTGKLLVLAGAYGDDAGGLYGLDPATGASYIAGVTGEDFAGVAATEGHAVVISLASDYSHYAHHCVDLGDGTISGSTSTMSYYSGISANDRGEAWVVASPSWLDENADDGVFVFDIDSCSAKTSEPLHLSLAAKDIAFF